MKPFEEILLMPSTSAVLAAKLSGRTISRVTDGFGDDPALGDMMNLFQTLEHKWPDRVLSLREMFELQLTAARKEQGSHEADLSGLTPEQREIWEKEKTQEPRAEKLVKALPKIIDIYNNATAEPDSWDDLTVINQWSLLNATERGLHKRLEQYRSWAADDEAKGREDTNAIRLRDEAIEELLPLGAIITAFLADPTTAEALKRDAANGIRVPTRLVA